MDNESPPTILDPDDLLVRGVLDGVGRIADASEAHARHMEQAGRDVAELRRELAAHAAREEPLLVRLAAYLDALATTQGQRVGEAAATLQAAEDEERARRARAWAALWRILGHPATVALVTAAIVAMAARMGLLADPPAPPAAVAEESHHAP